MWLHPVMTNIATYYITWEAGDVRVPTTSHWWLGTQTDIVLNWFTRWTGKKKERKILIRGMFTATPHRPRLQPISPTRLFWHVTRNTHCRLIISVCLPWKGWLWCLCDGLHRYQAIRWNVLPLRWDCQDHLIHCVLLEAETRRNKMRFSSSDHVGARTT